MADISDYMTKWDEFQKAKSELEQILETISIVHLAAKGKHPRFSFVDLPIGMAHPVMVPMSGMKTLNYEKWPDVVRFQNVLSHYHNSLQELRTARVQLGEQGSALPNPDA